MARVNITVPDDVLARAREEGLNVSAAATAGLREELMRCEKRAALDAYLRELEEEEGPTSPEERAAADRWVEERFGPATKDADQAA